MNANWIESLWLAGDELCLRWIITLLHFLWQGVAIGAVVIIAGWLLRRRSAALRYALNSVALVSLPLCVAITFAVVQVPQSWNVVEASSEPTLVRAESDLIVEGIPPATADFSPSVELPVAPIVEPSSDEAAFIPAREDSTASEATHDTPLVAQVAPLLVAAYFAGAFLCLLRLGVATWGGHRLRRGSRPVDDPTLLEVITQQSRKVGLKLVPVVAYCEKVAVPTIVGIIRPVMLLPVSLVTGLAPDQMAAIISHELAHIRRHDLLMNLLQRLIESLLFFHPVVWFISRRMSDEREACCDDLVVSSGHERMRYADALLRMAELCSVARQPDVAALAASGQTTTQFERRIRRLMNANQQPRPCLSRAGALTIVLLACSVAVMPAAYRNLVHAHIEAVAGSEVQEGERTDDHDHGEQPHDHDTPEEPVPEEDTPIPVPPRDPRVKSWPLEQQVSRAHPPLWASAVGAKPDELNWYSATGPLMLDNQRLLIGSDILDLRTGKTLGRLPLSTDEFAPTYMRLSADRKHLMVCGTVRYPPEVFAPPPNCVIQVWDVAQAKQIGRTIGAGLMSVGYPGGAADISADGKVVAAGGRGSIGLWDVSDGHVLKKSAWEARRVDALAFSPDGNWLVISDRNDLTYWKWRMDDEPRTIHVGRKIDSLAFSPDSRYLAEGPDSRGDIQIRDMQTLEIVRAVKDEAGLPLHVVAGALKFSADGRSLFAGNAITVDERKLKIPRRMYVWNVQTGKLQRQFAMPYHQVRALDVSPDGKHIAARVEDMEASLIAVWSLATEAPKDSAEATTGGDRENQLTFRGLRLNDFPSTTDPHSLTELYHEDPPGSGIYEWIPITCFMPLDRFVIYGRPEADLFFVKQETDRASIWYGPVPSDPIEKLDLEPLLLERMKRFGTAGNARISIARMACCGHAKLAATGVRLMRQMLTDKDTLNGIDKRNHSAHQAERNLDFVLTILRAHGAALRESEIEGVAELERAAMDMEARFAEAMPSVSDESYNEAGYLQKDLPSDESIRWGPANNGLRLGLVLKTPVVLTQDAEPHSVKLIVQNVSDRTICFHVEGYIAEWVRVDVTRPDGTRVRTEDGDIGVDIPAFPNPWRLEPGEKYELCENRLTVAFPDAEVRATGMRGMRSVVTRLRTTPGSFTANCIAPLNWRRVVRGKGEWSGDLTSSSFDITVK